MRNSIFLFCGLFSFNYLISQVTIKSVMPPSLDRGKTTTVDVTINKGGIQNFAKYQMDVPPGITVSEADIKGGNFTFENNRAKIVWVSAPSEPEFTLKLKILATVTAPEQVNIDQRFYYLDNGVKKEAAADMVMLSVGVNNTIAQAEPPSNTQNTSTTANTVAASAPAEPVKTTEPTTTNPTTVAKTETKSEPATERKTEPKTETKSEPKTETKSTTPVVASSADGFLYRVQLSAGSSDPGKSKFSALGTSNIAISKEDGLYKVLYGSYNSKEDAIKAKDAAASKGFQGFVVKYKDGVRVK